MKEIQYVKYPFMRFESYDILFLFIFDATSQFLELLLKMGLLGTDLISIFVPDPDSVGSGRLLSQTQTEVQTGASHQPDVWQQLRGGDGRTDGWTDGPKGGPLGDGKKNGEGNVEAFCFSELFEQTASPKAINQSIYHLRHPHQLMD